MFVHYMLFCILGVFTMGKNASKSEQIISEFAFNKKKIHVKFLNFPKYN